MKKKILHVDDEKDILDSVKIILEKEGYDVTSVSTGKEAVALVETHVFDLVILDIMMPNLSGADIFSMIMKINAEQKVIFLSVLEVSLERKKRLKNHGVSDYIQKPFDLEDFVKRVKVAIGD